MTDCKLRALVACIATLLLQAASYAKESARPAKVVARISAGFEYCVSTRREQAPTCPMRKGIRPARAVSPPGIPNGVFHALARELDAGAAASYDGVESPATWCSAAPAHWAGGIHALCALGSLEQRNFELLTTRRSEDGVATYPQLRISLGGVASYLGHISEARAQGGFTQLAAAATRAADKASADIDAGYRAWFASVHAQATFVSDHLEQRVMAVVNDCGAGAANRSCDGGRGESMGNLARFDVLTTLAELGAPPLAPRAARSPYGAIRVSVPARQDSSRRELLVTMWAAQAADEQRRRVSHLITAAQLTADRELIDAASEYAAAAMSQVTERAAQCALLCMDEAGLGDDLPVPMPIAADLTIPMTFVR